MNKLFKQADSLHKIDETMACAFKYNDKDEIDIYFDSDNNISDLQQKSIIKESFTKIKGNL